MDTAPRLLELGIGLIAVASFPRLPVAGAQISDGICALGVALVLLATRPRLTRTSIALFAAYALAGAISALVTHGSFLRLAGTWWLLVLAIGINAAATQDARRLERALVFGACVGAVTGLVGALLFFLGKPTGLLNHAGDLIPGHYPRIRGTMMRANGLAGLLATGIVLVPVLEPKHRKPAYAVLVLALVFTFSRSWISLAGTFGVGLFAFGPRRNRALVALVACATVTLMLVVSWFNVQLDPTRPWTLQILDEPGTRLVHLRDALAAIAAHPLTGVGPGRAAALGWDAHFTVANVAATLGIPAALAFVGLFCAALGRAWAAARAGDGVARLLALTLVLYAFDALARDVEDQRALWVVIGLALAVVSSRPSVHPPAER